jgi:hypothetical protein
MTSVETGRLIPVGLDRGPLWRERFPFSNEWLARFRFV